MLHKPERDSCSPTAYMQFNLQMETSLTFQKLQKDKKELFTQQLFFILYRVAMCSREGPTAMRHHLRKTTLSCEKYLH